MRALWGVLAALFFISIYGVWILMTLSYPSFDQDVKLSGNFGDEEHPDINAEDRNLPPEPNSDESKNPTTVTEKQYITPDKTKVIAWWIPKHKTPHKVWSSDPELLFAKCSHPCRILRMDEKLEDVDALIMNSRDSKLLRDPEGLLPRRTRADQIYVMYNREAPVRTATRIVSEHFRDVFNLTLTYRRDSDIPIPHFKATDRPSWGRNEDIDISNKTKLAIWIISHCTKAGSVRWKFGEALARYMPLEIYGKCGKPCPRYPKGICLQMAERDFKFYLSFENAVCKDYTTEKLQRPLMHNIVPVALGGMDFDDVIAPKAVIDIRKFKSPKLLAEYLKYLDKNDTAYLEHLQWKRKASVSTKGTGNWFCKLCDILHNSSYPYRSHFDPYQWWVEDAHCMTEKEQAAAMGVST